MAAMAPDFLLYTDICTFSDGADSVFKKENTIKDFWGTIGRTLRAIGESDTVYVSRTTPTPQQQGVHALSKHL